MTRLLLNPLPRLTVWEGITRRSVATLPGRTGHNEENIMDKTIDLDFATAEQGDATAQYKLGLMFEIGRGVPKDAVEAVKWYTIAAEQGYAPAQYNLGVMYRLGQGVPRSAVEALKWFTRAAEQGDASSQFFLGDMYHHAR